jgi:hypothetical protein
MKEIMLEGDTKVRARSARVEEVLRHVCGKETITFVLGAP